MPVKKEVVDPAQPLLERYHLFLSCQRTENIPGPYHDATAVKNMSISARPSVSRCADSCSEPQVATGQAVDSFHLA